MLSDAQIAAFERDGYLVVPDAVPDILRENVAAGYAVRSVVARRQSTR